MIFLSSIQKQIVAQGGSPNIFIIILVHQWNKISRRTLNGRINEYSYSGWR